MTGTDADTEAAQKRGSQTYTPRSDHQHQLSLQVNVLVREWEEIKANHATDIEAQRLLNLESTKKLAYQLVLCESVRSDLAEQQQANAELISASNDIHDDNMVAQNENCMLTAKIGTLTEIFHNTDGRVT